MKKTEGLTLEIYYDSTVEPFEIPEFNLERIERLLKILRGLGVKIKIVDTAGWSRRMLLDVFEKVSSTGLSFGNIFGSRKRRVFWEGDS